MKPAARLTDMHVCPMVIPGTPPIPHVGGPVTSPGSTNVFIGGLLAARVSDQCLCVPVGIPDPITMGSATVKINFMPAARMGDATAHGGVITSGCVTVLIGDSANGGSGGAGVQRADDGPAPPPPSPLASGQALSSARQAQALRAAAASGAPFCEACQRKKEAEEAAQLTQPVPPKRTPDLRSDLSKEWFKEEDGELKWPDNHGFADPPPPPPHVVKKGTLMDRYTYDVGENDTGNFFSEPGVPFEKRALPYDPSRMRYVIYEVLEDIPLFAGPAKSCFDQPGGGIQYYTLSTAQDLVKAGKLRVREVRGIGSGT